MKAFNFETIDKPALCDRWCYVSGGTSSSKQKSRSSSTAGVAREDRGLATEQAFRLAGLLEQGARNFAGTTPQLSLDPRSGLLPQQLGLVQDLVASGIQNQFNKLSAGGAARGQLSPANTSNLVGTATERAVTSAIPQFLQFQQQNALFNAQAPQQTQAQSQQFLQNIGGLLLGLTQGAEQKSKGSGSSLAVNFGFGR